MATSFRYLLVSAVVLLQLLANSRGDDWPQWGGPRRDLIWREKGIIPQLPPMEETEFLPRVWSVAVGAGYAGPAIAEGRVFHTDRIADAGIERVICLDADTGEIEWSHQYLAEYTISYPLGPRATPTVDGERVYTLGAVGHFYCFHANTGEILWQKNLPRDLGAKLPTWGMAAAPLVDGDQLILLAGGEPGALVVSFDKRTGAEIWRALEDDQVGYCPPVILEFGGERQLIVWHPNAVTALDPADGTVLWEEPFAVEAGLCIATPRKSGKRLLVTTFYNGPLMVDLGDDGRSPRVLWRTGAGNNEVKNDSLHAIMCTPIFAGKSIFGVGSYGDLRCLDADSGEMVWETRQATGHGRWWNAFLVPQGDRVFICNEQGELIIARLDRGGYHEIDRAPLIEPTQAIRRRMTVWSHPAFAMGSVFARNDKQLIRVDLSME